MIIYYVNQALIITLLISAPVVIVTMLLGLILGFLQAVFQLQDQALPFAIKWVAVTLILVALGPWIGQMLVDFNLDLFELVSRPGVGQ